jgi:4-hydroxy-3-methylbut-2-enyl diphosphate reductase
MKLLVLAPLAIEALAVRSGLPGVKVRRTGMGRRAVELGDAEAVGIAGLCGAVDPSLRAGDVVLATELRSEDGTTVACPGSSLLAEPLRRMGLGSAQGTLYTASRILGREERAELRSEGVLAVDMESAWLAEAAGERPVAVLRIVVDTAERRLASARTVLAGIRGLWTLRRASAAFVEWAELCTASRAPAPSRERLCGLQSHSA